MSTPMSIEDFYGDSAERSASEEVPLGDEWHLSADQGARYKVVWLRTTGELVAIRMPFGTMRYVRGYWFGPRLETVPLEQVDVTAEILATGMSASAVEELSRQVRHFAHDRNDLAELRQLCSDRSKEQI